MTTKLQLQHVFDNRLKDLLAYPKYTKVFSDFNHHYYHFSFGITTSIPQQQIIYGFSRLLRAYFMSGFLSFIKCYLYICQKDHIFSFILLWLWIVLTGFKILYQVYILRITIHYLFLLISETSLLIFVKNFYIHDHEEYWYGILFFNVFARF